MLSKEFIALKKEKSNICVSMIIPTHRLSPQRRADKPEMEKAMETVKQVLLNKYPEKETKPLLKKMNEWYEKIDFIHNADGLGLYISPNITYSVSFPFPVEEKVMVGDNFEIRDLLYKENYSHPYFILILTEKGARLFRGIWNELTEIDDKYFPNENEAEYSYAQPSSSSSLAGYAHVKSYEKDKSEMEVIHLKKYFLILDKSLNNYLTGDTSLVITGAKKELALFEDLTVHKKRIIHKIPGNYQYFNPKQLTDIVWPGILEHLHNEQVKMVREFEEKTGENHAIYGISEIWNATREGKAFKLLVEKDYRVPGFLVNDDLHLHPSKKPHKILADAVDDLIEMVLEKNGHVFFVDNGMLKNYQRIGLITRY